MGSQKKFLNVALLYTAANLLSRGLNFLLLPLYSNLITPTEYGIYSLLLSAYTIIAVLYQGGLSSGFSKFYVEESGPRKNDYTSTFLYFIGGLGIFCTLVLSIFSVSISAWFLETPSYYNLIILTAVMLLTDSLFFSVIHILRTREESKPAALYSLLYSIVNLVGNFVFVYYLRRGVEGIFYSSISAGIICIALTAPLILKWFKGSFHIPYLNKMWIFSLPLIAAGILSTLVDVFDRFLLNIYYDKTAVGLYSFSYKLAFIMNIFSISFRSAWTPYSIRNVKEGKHEHLFGDIFLQMAGINALIMLIIILLIDDLFLFQIGDFKLINAAYGGSLPLIPLILLGYGINWIASFYSVYPYVSGKSGHFLASDLIGFIINLAFNIILIPILYLQGAAAATFLSLASSSLYLYFISRGKLKIIYPQKRIIYTAVLFVLCAACGYFFKNILLDAFLIIFYSWFLFKLEGLKISDIKNLFKRS